MMFEEPASDHRCSDAVGQEILEVLEALLKNLTFRKTED